MSSFYAELTVDGQTPYPLRQCQFEFTQATDQRGRAAAKVRHGLLHLTLDVPTDDQLLDWANTVHKPLSGHITFFEDDRKTARETVSFAAGQCVSYQESFVAGDGEVGAYVCQLVVTSTGLTLTLGGASQPYVAPAAHDYATAAVATVAPVAIAATASPATAVRPEYTLAEFTKTIWGIDQVAPEIGEQLYQHFNAAKASADPTPHWAAMETLIRSTTFINKKTGLPEVLNGGWPPANGGFNKILVQPAPPDKFDRYQKEVELDAKTGNPKITGSFTSPIPSTGAFDYEARALEGQEKDYDLMYEIEVLKPLPFMGEEATIIPWHGHQGNGTQTKILFPPYDPVIKDYPWSWERLQREGYINITYKNSPSGKLLVSSDGKAVVPKTV